ncbi:MAG TPA: glycosyltransferase family 4 protein [Chloroflexia bacterium]|nr:glycosyltransferase family 4 protein [Chloroflexia bacterium]
MASMQSQSIASSGRERGPLQVLYFIGSYGPDVMGNASHEQTVLAMRERGHEVEVLTQITEPGVSRYTRVVYSGVPVYRVNLAAGGGRLSQVGGKLANRLLKYEYLITLLAAYRRHLRGHKYDLIHVEGAYPFGLVAAFGGGLTPYLANVQGADVIDLPEADYGYRRFRLPRIGVSLALRRAELVRSISPLLADYLDRERLAPPSKVAVVLRALENSAFPPADVALEQFRREGRAFLSSKYGIGIPRPVVMLLSRLHPFKGVEYLVDAIPHIVAAQRERGAEPPWFLICGPSRSTEHYGDYREFLRKRAEAAGVASHVVFTGQVPHNEVRHHLAGADIFVCPSILEAQNKVVPEACAVGTPSVATETTGIVSYLAPLDACVSVPPRSAESIAAEITRLLNEPQHYLRVRQNALDVAETLRVEAIAPQLEEVWWRAATPPLPGESSLS